MLGVLNPEVKLKEKLDELDKTFTVNDLVDKATFMEICSTIASSECFTNK